MQARSSRSWGMGTGKGRGRGHGCAVGRGRTFATSLLGLWATLNHAHVASSLSSGTSCPTEGIICAADEVCSVCIDTLRSLSASSLGFGASSVDCDELLFDLCSLVKETACDYTNDKFVALATCTVEDATGCSSSSSCDEVLLNGGSTPAPADPVGGGDATSSAPTGSPTAVVWLTESPDAAAAAAVTAAPSGVEEVEEVTEAGDDTNGGSIGLTTFSVATALGVGLIAGMGLLLSV